MLYAVYAIRSCTLAVLYAEVTVPPHRMISTTGGWPLFIRFMCPCVLPVEGTIVWFGAAQCAACCAERHSTRNPTDQAKMVHFPGLQLTHTCFGHQVREQVRKRIEILSLHFAAVLVSGVQNEFVLPVLPGQIRTESQK